MPNRSMPRFTRRDFQYIADIIAELRRVSYNELVTMGGVEDAFTEALRYTNAGFKEDTFREACNKNT